MKKIVVLFIFCFSWGLSYGATVHDNMKIYYIPFETETYVAVTTDNIKLQAHHKVVVSSIQDVNSLNRIFSNRTAIADAAPFDFKRVRLLISSSEKHDIFIDSYGNILSNGKQEKISKKKFNELNSRLSYLIKIRFNEK